ncbi:acyl-CoA dehydrogenase family protein [Nonomuraea fastidiosa]|uniref:acyl-CoA dehydrogenase family protein n=1 Tax=Nonomuraea fastidiosa TaxID=46173 RepID=UPI00366EA964
MRTERRPGWKQLAGLGFFGSLLPPEDGGLGLRLIDVLPALEETGRACLPGPVAETAAVAAALRAGTVATARAAGRVVRPRAPPVVWSGRARRRAS